MIRSYQRVGRTVMQSQAYVIGKRSDGTPLRLPFPIPVIGLIWGFVAFVVLLAVGRAFGIASLPSHAGNSAAYGPVVLWHIALPVAIAYFLTVAEVEGRRVHVILRAWAQQGFAKHYVGGYGPTGKAGETFRYRQIRVRHRAQGIHG